MKIAITGANGFIGTRLHEALKSSYPDAEFILLDIQKTRPGIILADVTNPDAMMEHLKGVDVIYHLAAEHRDDVQPIRKYYDVNVGGAENIITAARKHGIKTIIFTSSVAVYGLNAGDSNETSTPAPFNDYGQSKLDSEKVFEAWANESPDNKLMTLRLVATFGPGNRGNIYNLINQIARKKFIMIGNGKNRKSIAYVENVAGFLVHLLKTTEPGIHIYNYADKPDMDMNTLVNTSRKALGQTGSMIRLPYIIGLLGGFAFDILAKLTRRTFPISTVRVQKFCADTIVNADKAHATFTPLQSLTDGLEVMIKEEFNN